MLALSHSEFPKQNMVVMLWATPSAADPPTIAYCSEIVDSLHFCRNGSQISDAQTSHLSCLVSPFRRRGGSWDDPGTSGSTRKGAFRSRLVLLSISGAFKDLISKACWVLWIKIVYFSCLIPDSFF